MSRSTPMPSPHPAHDVPDERLALPVEEGVLLWCMRVWVVGLRREIDAAQRIAQMLGRLDAPDAAPYLDGFMYALGHAATRTLGISCVCQPRIGPDERVLLDVLALVQRSRPFEALLLLRDMLTPEGARAALRSAEGIGEALALAGRVLPPPVPAIADRQDPPPIGFSEAVRPPGATLH